MAKFSFTTMGTPLWDGPTAIQNAKKLGYDGVDLRISDHKGELSPSASSGDMSALKKVFDCEGIECAGLLCYNATARVGDADSWKAMTESVYQHAQIGIEMHSPSIRIFGGPIHEAPDILEYISCFAQMLDDVLTRTPESLHIILQNHGGSFTFLQGVELCKRLNNPRFGMAFSPDHSFMMGEDLKQVFAQAKAYSQQFYVSDTLMKPDANGVPRSNPVLPGQGEVPLAQAYESLGGKQFSGWISFKWEKIWHDELAEPEIALPYFMEMVKSMW